MLLLLTTFMVSVSSFVAAQSGKFKYLIMNIHVQYACIILTVCTMHILFRCVHTGVDIVVGKDVDALLHFMFSIIVSRNNSVVK